MSKTNKLAQVKAAKKAKQGGAASFPTEPHVPVAFRPVAPSNGESPFQLNDVPNFSRMSAHDVAHPVMLPRDAVSHDPVQQEVLNRVNAMINNLTKFVEMGVAEAVARHPITSQPGPQGPPGPAGPPGPPGASARSVKTELPMILNSFGLKSIVYERNGVWRITTTDGVEGTVALNTGAAAVSSSAAPAPAEEKVPHVISEAPQSSSVAHSVRRKYTMPQAPSV